SAAAGARVKRSVTEVSACKGTRAACARGQGRTTSRRHVGEYHRQLWQCTKNPVQAHNGTWLTIYIDWSRIRLMRGAREKMKSLLEQLPTIVAEGKREA